MYLRGKKLKGKFNIFNNQCVYTYKGRNNKDNDHIFSANRNFIIHTLYFCENSKTSDKKQQKVMNFCLEYKI